MYSVISCPVTYYTVRYNQVEIRTANELKNFVGSNLLETIKSYGNINKFIHNNENIAMV